MRALLQRVSSASVSVAGDEIGSIGCGLLVLLGVVPADDERIAEQLAEKTVEL
jgi:D-tyrosyl-tRNA(Tyr) deacylase